MADLIRMSFSGSDCDIFGFVSGPGAVNSSPLVHLDSLQTLSVSIYRDKVPVRALGFTDVKGFSRGSRTVAGSMVFTVLEDNPLKKLMSKEYVYDFSYDGSYVGSSLNDLDITYPDVIPPFHLVVSYHNELGGAAVMEVIGVDIMADGIVTSVQDILTEKTIQYKARGIREFHAIEGPNGLSPDNNFLDKVVEQLLDGTINATTSASLEVPKADGRSLASKLSSPKGIG